MLVKACRGLMLSGCMLGLALGLGACGDDEEKKADGSGDDCEGDKCLEGSVVKATGDVAEVDFGDAKAGSEFIIMPYALGDLSTTLGATDAVTYSVKFTSSAAGGAKAAFHLETAKNRIDLDQQQAWATTKADYDKRMLIRNFDPARGEKQIPGFWSTAERLSQWQRQGLIDQGKAWALSEPSIEEYFRLQIKKHAAKSQPRAQLTSLKAAATCPNGEVSVPQGNSFTKITATVTDEGDYCLAIAATPTTEADTTKIKSAIAGILKKFQSADFYNDKFADTKKNANGESIVFKPVIAIVDFGDAAAWPQDAAYQVAGAFIGTASKEAGMSMLYMPSNIKKIASMASASDDNAKLTWYGTLAHELQHAIINYYRFDAAAKAETAPIDEGLAHVIEDVFGHGRFDGFPASFLSIFPNAIAPVLDASNSEDVSRGAVHCLLYYLASKKGGFTVTDGYVTGGAGLGFLANIAKSSTTQGAVTPQKVYGGDWVETFGDFLGALVLDNSANEGIPEKYSLPAVNTDMKNLVGGKTTFGIRFNKFGTIAALPEYEAAGDSINDLKLYMTKPVKVTLKSDGGKLKVNFGSSPQNAAVAVVRTK